MASQFDPITGLRYVHSLLQVEFDYSVVIRLCRLPGSFPTAGPDRSSHTIGRKC
jgi:hypothetical protein